MSAKHDGKSAAGVASLQPNEASSNFPLFNPGDYVKLGNQNVAAMSRAAQACFNGASEINRQFAEFVNQRLKKDFAAARVLLASKSSEDAFNAQAEFVETALRDYAEETTRLLNLAADIARDAMKPDGTTRPS
jgi:hypothetical protein